MKPRASNLHYRLLKADDLQFTAEDFFLLDGAFDQLTDEEMNALGNCSLKIETEGREGLGFTEVTDHEREFAKILKKVLRGISAKGRLAATTSPMVFSGGIIGLTPRMERNGTPSLCWPNVLIDPITRVMGTDGVRTKAENEA